MSDGLQEGVGGGGRVVTVFGATGFLGRRIAARLLGEGWVVRAASRNPERPGPPPAAGRRGAEPVRADVHDEDSVAAAMAGAHGAVNAVSLYVEGVGRRASFRSVHVDAAARVARCARDAGVARLVHVSGIGADPASGAAYIRARGEGENAVRQAFPQATIVRPAAMFGPTDSFLTSLARLVRALPVFPLFGEGRTRLQPVHAEDVAEAVARMLAATASDLRPCYELGGPRIYSYAALIRAVADAVGVRPRLLPVPFAAWDALAFLAEFAPGAPVTRAQVALMRHDSIASGQCPGLRELGIAARDLESTLAAIGRGLRLSFVRGTADH